MAEINERKQDICDTFKATNSIHGGSSLMASYNSNCILKSSPPNTITWGLGFQYMNCWVWIQIFSSPQKLNILKIETEMTKVNTMNLYHTDLNRQ